MEVNNFSIECNPSASKKLWLAKGRLCDWVHGKKRDHSPEKDWNKTNSLKRRNSETFREDKDKNRHKEELKLQPEQQCLPQPMSIHSATTSTYPTNGYATSDYYAVDPIQNNYMIPQYNMYNTMNQLDASVSSTMPNMDMASTSTGMNPYPYFVPTDPSMYRMLGPMPGFCPMPMMNGAMQSMPPQSPKNYPNCTLVPPPAGAPPPPRRNRPNGCKTVFVGGLPEKITEEIIKEVFSDCGEIATIRMSKKHFCHIRFTSEQAVDPAMYLSGYRIKIENKDEFAYSSRLHVDFAIARDDQYEYECLMRILLKKTCHANRVACPPSPPPIVNYSECEAVVVGKNLRNEEAFKSACDVLISWLDRGECNKRNAATFYSMIQSTYSHVKRLVAEKTKIEDEFTAVKERLHQKSTSNAAQLTDIEKVFQYALMQKVWDHFSKAQRKDIDQWQKHTNDTKMANLEDLLDQRIEDEMEMSDSEDRDPSKDSEKSTELKEELKIVRENQIRLQEEIEMLRNQLRTANEETTLVKDEGEKKIAALEKTIKERLALSNQKNMSLNETGIVNVTESEARLVSLIVMFLNIHPLGASIDYICSYLVKIDRSINTRDVEHLMKKFNTVFKEESTGSGDTLEKKWIFWGYKFYTSVKV